MISRLAVVLGAMALAFPALAAGVDSHAYTCGDLQRLVASTGFVFINNPDFQDFVVASPYYCGGTEQIELRSVPTRDRPECTVNYCIPNRSGIER